MQFGFTEFQNFCFKRYMHEFVEKLEVKKVMKGSEKNFENFWESLWGGKIKV